MAKNVIKVNANIVTVMHQFEKGLYIHLANIDLRSCLIYMTADAPEYLNGVTDGRPIEWLVRKLEGDNGRPKNFFAELAMKGREGRELYQGKFDICVPFSKCELNTILKQVRG